MIIRPIRFIRVLLIMVKRLIILSIFILCFLSCNKHQQEVRAPDYINQLKEKPAPPNSGNFKLNLEWERDKNDSLRVHVYLLNQDKSNYRLVHSSDFVKIAVYDGNKLLYPEYPDKLIFWDDYNETIVPSEDTLTLSRYTWRKTDLSGAESVAYIKFDLYERFHSDSSAADSENYWLVSKPKQIPNTDDTD